MEESNYLYLTPGKTTFVGDDEYVIVGLLDSESIICKHIETKKIEKLKIADLRPEKSTKSSDDKFVDVTTVHDKDWKTAQRRLEIIRPLLETEKYYRKTEDIEKRAKQFNISKQSLYRWIDKYESSGTVSSLIPAKRNDKGVGRLDSEIELIIKQCINDLYLTSQKCSAQVICNEVEKRCRIVKLKPPHPNTVRNRISNLSSELLTEKRVGKRFSKELYEPIKGPFPGANWPLAVVQIDHTKLDIILVDDIHRRPIGRPWITLAIDVFSRMVTGFYVSFDPPGALSTGLCISQSILPKENLIAKYDINTPWPVWGKMDAIHVDNAREFRGRMLERACYEYGIEVIWRPVARPHFGGHIERLLGTILKEIHTLPGTTFSDIFKRKGYDSESKSALTLSEFERWLLTYIVEDYHQNKHSGINTSPINKWKEGVFGDKNRPAKGLPPKIVNEDKLRLDFMPFYERSIQRYGVVINEIHYYSDVLRRWINAINPKDKSRKRKFIFKYDPRDISIIYFFDPELEQYFQIPYRDSSRPPMTLWEYREARALLKQQGTKNIDEETIFNARNKLTKLVEKSVKETKKARRSQQRRINIENVHTKNSDSTDNRLNETISDEDLKPFDDLEELF